MASYRFISIHYDLPTFLIPFKSCKSPSTTPLWLFLWATLMLASVGNFQPWSFIKRYYDNNILFVSFFFRRWMVETKSTDIHHEREKLINFWIYGLFKFYFVPPKSCFINFFGVPRFSTKGNQRSNYFLQINLMEHYFSSTAEIWRYCCVLSVDSFK